MTFGQIDITKIELDPKSRDDIPQILKGLQHIYSDVITREKLFQLLQKEIAPKVSKNTGRPGMELWKLLVLGCLRVNLNLDYDKLHELANKHLNIRQMLGHSENTFGERYYYELQTLKDNIKLMTPELLDQVNQIVVESGYRLIKKKSGEPLHGRCDSFVVETNVHYPTDINLLRDAMHKVITLIARLCESRNISDWRQSAYNYRQIKQFMRKAQNSKRSKSQKTQTEQEGKLKQTHLEYINTSRQYLSKVEVTITKLTTLDLTMQEIAVVQTIRKFMFDGYRQIEQIHARVIMGEVISHDKKIFSLFKPYTEWISKGKAGVPVEFGLRVCIMEDQHQFILHHMVMEKQTDDQVAVAMVKETQKRFSRLSSCSFDKGFHSPENQKELSTCLELVALARKGKLSKAATIIENDDKFRKIRRQHSAVESAINALEVHGLDCCPDYGITNFKRYVALAIVGRNIQQIGVILRAKEKEITQKKRHRIDDKIQKLAA